MAWASARKWVGSVGVMVSSVTQTRGGRVAQNSTAAAMSSGCAIFASCSGVGFTGRLSRIGVTTSPGLMQMLRMPWMPSSALSEALIARAPYLAAVYTGPETG